MEDGIVAALTENGGERANLAVQKLLALTVTAEGPTRKWQAVNVVMELVKMGAIAGMVAESSMEQIVAAWNSSCQPGSEGHAELLQAALLDLLTQLAGLSAEVSASVEGASCHMIRCDSSIQCPALFAPMRCIPTATSQHCSFRVLTALVLAQQLLQRAR